MLTGMLIGAAAASLVLLGWAASQLRWLAAHCSKQIAYWREEAEQARRNSLADIGQAARYCECPVTITRGCPSHPVSARCRYACRRRHAARAERPFIQPHMKRLPDRRHLTLGTPPATRRDPCGHAAQHRTFHTVPPGE